MLSLPLDHACSNSTVEKDEEATSTGKKRRRQKAEYGEVAKDDLVIIPADLRKATTADLVCLRLITIDSLRALTKYY